MREVKPLYSEIQAILSDKNVCSVVKCHRAMQIVNLYARPWNCLQPMTLFEGWRTECEKNLTYYSENGYKLRVKKEPDDDVWLINMSDDKGYTIQFEREWPRTVDEFISLCLSHGYKLYWQDDAWKAAAEGNANAGS